MAPVLKIFVVEDDREYLALLQAYFTHRGYSVSPFQTGAAALEAARLDPPNLILTDVMMPETSGLELVRSFASDSDLRKIPIVALTGSRFSPTVRDLFIQEHNVRAFLDKSSELEDILRKVQELIPLS